MLDSFRAFLVLCSLAGKYGKTIHTTFLKALHYSISPKHICSEKNGKEDEYPTVTQAVFSVDPLSTSFVLILNISLSLNSYLISQYFDTSILT